VSAAKRDKLVTIQEYTTANRAASGFPVEPWENLGQEWMSKEDASGEERLHTGGMAAAFDTKWVCPYRTDMDPEAIDVPKKRRLMYGGRTFDITRAVLSDRVERHKIVLETIASAKQ
jgi:SPP1 family predicted phage head-tail adaptor